MPRTRMKKTVDRKQTKDIKVLKKKVKALEAPIERKFLDTAIDGYITANNETYVLNNVQIADQDGTIVQNNLNMSKRVGKAIHMSRIRIKGVVGITGDQSTVGDFSDQKGRIRMVLVRWQENDAASVSVPSDFLVPALYGSTYSNEDALIDGYKRKFPANRYEVLYDRTVYLQTEYQRGASVAAGTPAAPVFPASARVSIDVKLNHDANWALVENAATPTQHPICLYLFASNQSPDVGTQRYTALLNSRLDYTDA